MHCNMEYWHVSVINDFNCRLVGTQGHPVDVKSMMQDVSWIK